MVQRGLYCLSMLAESQMNLDALDRVGTALADPTRRRILAVLLEAPAHPSDLADHLGVGRSNISNHLACLRGCGLVVAITQGRQVCYELASPALAAALEALAGLHLEITSSHADLAGSV